MKVKERQEGNEQSGKGKEEGRKKGRGRGREEGNSGENKDFFIVGLWNVQIRLERVENLYLSEILE